MLTLRIALLVLALVCLLLAALNVTAPRVNLLALGLTFWVGSLLVA